MLTEAPGTVRITVRRVVPRNRAPITAPVAMKPRMISGCGKRPCTRPAACRPALTTMAPSSVPAGTRSRFSSTATAPPARNTAKASAGELTLWAESPAGPAGGVPLAIERTGGIRATSVKTRRLWARMTRGGSALLFAASTATEENAPAIEAKRAVVLS